MIKNNLKQELTDRSLKALLDKGKRRGFITYEEMNDDLPDDGFSPDSLDNLLMTLDDLGIELIDEADIDQQGPKDSAAEGKDLDEQDAELERVLRGAEPDRRIDDPVRMYLTQMGEIPLLKREQEIALAKKIEMASVMARRSLCRSVVRLTRIVPPPGSSHSRAPAPPANLPRPGRTSSTGRSAVCSRFSLNQTGSASAALMTKPSPPSCGTSVSDHSGQRRSTSAPLKRPT